MKSASKAETYSFIQNSPFSIGESDLVAYLDESRLDPRLMEVCVEFIRDFWYILDPKLLNRKAKASQFPFMIKAAAILVLSYCGPESGQAAVQFTRWMKEAITGIKDPAPQFLYVGVIPIGSKMATRTLHEAIPELLNHNLVEAHLPFNKGIPKDIKDEAWARSRFGIEALKAHYASQVKSLKVNHSNSSIEKITGANRMFVSKILNNKLNGISLEYLMKAAEAAQSIS
ncbi:hypothetical protein [Bdellovibrio sp. BCCA]|uniref:hypothetical protein n=1 Tax=Bdellovibrio sp. BCCA TaxID=3136281 RepID=UPI0030F0A8DA